jgi:endoglucanase
VHRGGTRSGRLTAVVTAAAGVLAVAVVGPAGASAVPARTHARLALSVAPVPLARWQLAETTGTTAHDDIAGRDGSVLGPVRLGQVAQGPTVTSYGFAGGRSSVAAPATGLVPSTRAVSAWVRLPRAPRPAGGSVLDLGSISVAVSRTRLAVSTCAVASPCATRLLPVRFADGAWHQLAASISGGQVTVFVDGAPAGTALATAADRLPADGDVAIGRGFHGNIDRVTLWDRALTAGVVGTEFTNGACPQSDGPVPTTQPAPARPPALPLHTRGRFVVDANGQRVKLAGVNWYGADQLDHVPAGLQCQRVDAIAARIAADGFNVVRLPWATTTWSGKDKPVPPVAVAGDPSLRGKTARQVFDAVIASLARHGVLVILDNHVTRPRWCCSGTDGNGLWWEGYDPQHPPRWHQLGRRQRLHRFRVGEQRWLSAWRRIVRRYAVSGAHAQPMVVGADLRNEVRPDYTLGITPHWRRARGAPWADWPRAATRACDAVLSVNPRLLVAVEGLQYAADLRGVARQPIRLARAHRLVYSAHDYSWTQSSHARLHRVLGRRWGWLLAQHQRLTTPVLVGEFGTCHPEECGGAEAAWFKALTRYLAAGDVDWIYWSINGTGGRGAVEPTTCAATLRFPGCGEGYGLSDPSWSRDVSAALMTELHPIIAATQGP